MQTKLIAAFVVLLGSVFISILPNKDILKNHKITLPIAYLMGIGMSLLLILKQEDSKDIACIFFGLYGIFGLATMVSYYWKSEDQQKRAQSLEKGYFCVVWHILKRELARQREKNPDASREDVLNTLHENLDITPEVVQYAMERFKVSKYKGENYSTRKRLEISGLKGEYLY